MIIFGFTFGKAFLTLVVLGLICAVVTGLIAVWQFDAPFPWGIVGTILGIFFALAVVMGVPEDTLNAKKQEAAVLCREENYTLYIDGIETDIEKIDISQYSKVSIDDEKRVVFIRR